MSETVLKILLEELSLVRLHCRNASCGGVVEAPLPELQRFLQNAGCPFCGASFRVMNANSLADLAEAVRALKTVAGKVGVEFVIPVKGAVVTLPEARP